MNKTIYNIPCARCGTPFLSFHLSAKYCEECKRKVHIKHSIIYRNKRRKNTMYTNYTEIPNKIRNFTPFRSSSAYAIREGKKYIIVSYNTTIAEIDMTRPIVTYFNKEKYSSTTTRLQNIIQKVIEEEQWHSINADNAEKM